MHSAYAGYKQGVAMSNQNAESSGYLDTTSMMACDFFLNLFYGHSRICSDCNIPGWSHGLENATATTPTSSKSKHIHSYFS